MALWARVQKLDGDGLQQIGLAYGEDFPVDVRCALAHWIEDQPWNDVDPDKPQHDAWAAQLVNNLINEVEFKSAAADNFLMRLKLKEAASEFKKKYSNNPQQLVRIIKNCLQTEQRIIQQTDNFCNGLNNHNEAIPDPSQEILLTLDKLKHKTQEITEEVRQMQQGQEAFVIQYQESLKRQAQFHQASSNPEMAAKLQQEKELFDQAIRQKVADLVHLRIKIVERQEKILMELNDLQKRVLEIELVQWKRAQQLAGNGVTFENNLNEIQGWCEGLADIIWQNRQLIKQIESLCKQVNLNVPGDTMAKLPMLNSQSINLLSALVTSTFVIEKQPPQVLKTSTNFTASVRLLVGSKLGFSMAPPQVKVKIISESQTIALLQNKLALSNDQNGSVEPCGQILNNMSMMEYDVSTRQLAVNFKNLQLRKFKRSEKKGTESVMDEKFSILFESQLYIGCGELFIQVWILDLCHERNHLKTTKRFSCDNSFKKFYLLQTALTLFTTLSLPVVVIVHGVQEPQAWATITWDNAFSEPGRVPFQVPERIPWSKMAEVLSTKFRAATCRELMPESLQFLGNKILKSTQVLDNDLPITWSQFCKELLPDRNFTFWEWFYAIMKTTRDHLRNLWNDGLIIGFVSRYQAEEMLLKKVSGTFLLRFSDSELGGVTIAWVTSQQREISEVLMIQPFTGRDFAIRSLADRIKDLNNLVYLYPDIPKDQAFGKYYSPLTENQPHRSNGYLKPILVTQIPGLSQQGYDCPTTPMSQCSDISTASSYVDVDDMMSDPLSDIFEMDDPGDFTSINVNDLVPYSETST